MEGAERGGRDRGLLTRARPASALVTGGAGGLGAATAWRLVADGYRVVLFDRDAARCQEVATSLGAVPVAGDLDDDDRLGVALGAAVDAAPLRVLVNAAGGAVGGGVTLGADRTPHDLGAFERTMRVNALGTFNACRLAAATMATGDADDDGQRGTIVNTASVAGFEGQRGQVAYAAAKAAILGMTLPMARDLAPVGIRVCAIAPGPMATPALVRIRDRLEVDPADGIVFPPRLGDPDEYADLVAAIVANPYLNGENVRLDGALRLRG